MISRARRECVQCRERKIPCMGVHWNPNFKLETKPAKHGSACILCHQLKRRCDGFRQIDMPPPPYPSPPPKIILRVRRPAAIGDAPLPSTSNVGRSSPLFTEEEDEGGRLPAPQPAEPAGHAPPRLTLNTIRRSPLFNQDNDDDDEDEGSRRMVDEDASTTDPAYTGEYGFQIFAKYILT